MPRFCQRCGACIVSGGALAELSEPGSSRTAVALCADCTWLVKCAMQPTEELNYQARIERSSQPSRGGLDRGGPTFADLAGRYRDGAPITIRRRSS